MEEQAMSQRVRAVPGTAGLSWVLLASCLLSQVLGRGLLVPWRNRSSARYVGRRPHDTTEGHRRSRDSITTVWV